MDWLLYVGIPTVGILVIGARIFSKMLRKRRDDDGDDFGDPDAGVRAPLKPRPLKKSASAVADRPETDEEEEL